MDRGQRAKNMVAHDTRNKEDRNSQKIGEEEE
jgi:hypothetical protein